MLKMDSKTFGTREKSTRVLLLLRATRVMTVRHDGFAGADEGAEGGNPDVARWEQQRKCNYLAHKGEKLGTKRENIWRAR
jgi:hypothetical protein